MNEIKNMNNFNNPMMNQGNINNNMNNNNCLQMNQQMMQQQQMMALQMQQQQMMAAQQAQIQNYQGNFNHSDFDEGLEESNIRVIFRLSGEIGPSSQPVYIDCFPNDIISSIIEKYKNKSNINENGNKFVYIFNAKNLNQNLTVSEAGITNNSSIFVVRTKNKKDNNS